MAESKIIRKPNNIALLRKFFPGITTLEIKQLSQAERVELATLIAEELHVEHVKA